MTEKGIEEQATLYVLDLLSGEELASFEGTLQDSPELKRLVRDMREGLFQSAKKSRGPVRMDLLDGIHTRLGLDEGTIPLPTSVRKKSSFPWSYIWAAVAMMFLGLNLMLLFLMGNRNSPKTGNLAAESGYTADAEGVDSLVGEGLSPGDVLLLRAQIERLRTALSAKEHDLQSKDKVLVSLESENQEIRSNNAGWQREYTRLAAKFLPFFESNDGMSRFTVIEMVDEESYNQGSPGRGFAELAGSFLLGEGNIAGVGDIAYVGPVAAGAGFQTSTADPEVPGLTPSIRGETGALAGAIPEMDQAIPPDDSFSQEVETSPALMDNGEPAGFTVWRDDEQKGFLDLYNLPEADQGEAAFLWVRSSELEPYLPVGYLPELENGTGSLFYEVDEINFTPSEILVTSELEGQETDIPSGNILLRGP